MGYGNYFHICLFMLKELENTILYFYIHYELINYCAN